MPLVSINSCFGTTSTFFLQTMKHCTPNVTVLGVMAGFFVAGIAFLIIGMLSIMTALQQLSISVPYGQGLTEADDGVTQTLSLLLPLEDVRRDKPIFFYYHLDDFHQNVRYYVSSYSRTQLQQMGSFKDAMLDADCNPVKNRDDAVDYPCGLIYASMFNDTLQILVAGDSALTSRILDRNVAWPQDFKGNQYYGDAFKSLPNRDDVAVWMRTAPLTSFSKLYAKISSEDVADLVDAAEAAGDVNIPVTVTVGNHFFLTPKKSFQVQQMSALGGKTETMNLGILSTALGGVLMILGFVYMILFFALGPLSKKYETARPEFQLVTKSSVMLEEMERTGNERVRQVVKEVKREMGLT